MDAMLTGCSYWVYGESYPIHDPEYTYNTAIFQSCVNISSIIPHFACFGMEIHMGLIHPRGESKTEMLFWLKHLFMYDNAETFDHADLSGVIVDE